MTQFREVKKDETFPKIEERVLSLWDADKSFEKSLDRGKIRRRSIFTTGLRSRPAFRTTGICSRGLSRISFRATGRWRATGCRAVSAGTFTAFRASA